MASKREKRERRRERVSAARTVQEDQTSSRSAYLRLPDGYSEFRPKVGKYRLDFLPYRVGKWNPRCDEGGVHFERTFWIHKEIGPNNDWHLCLAKCYNKPCPVCEYRAKLAKDPNADEDTIKALSPKRRQLWLPVNVDEPDEKLIWNESYHNFGIKLYDKIRNADEEDEYEFFADPEEGYTVRVAFAQSDFGRNVVQAADLEMKSRKRQYDFDIVDEVPCLDDLLIPLDYDQLKKLFMQIEDEDESDKEDDEDSKTRRSRRGRSRAGDDDSDVGDQRGKKRKDRERAEKAGLMVAEDKGLEEGMEVFYEEETMEIVHISGDGTSLRLEDSEGNLIRSVAVSDVEPVESSKRKTRNAPDSEEDKEEERPRSRRDMKVEDPDEAPADDDDDEDDDWDDD